MEVVLAKYNWSRRDKRYRFESSKKWKTLSSFFPNGAQWSQIPKTWPESQILFNLDKNRYFRVFGVAEYESEPIMLINRLAN